MTNGQLLEQYVSGQDEASFRALVLRHGPSVLAACRRALRDPADVEDAFQATFLVLLRKAPTIQDPEALGSWLYGVAFRIALRVRRSAARRREYELRRATMHTEDDPPGLPEDDLHGVVREELASLPGPYRVPLELCYLRGRSHEEAADELGWPLGTLKTRLVRGRRQLRDRLDRRGVAIGLALWLLLRPRPASAVPPDLVATTVDVMRREARSGLSPAGAAPSRASLLAQEFLETKVRRLGLTLLLALLAVCAGSAAFARGYERARLAEIDAVASLPAGLTDILNVLCR